MVQKALSGAWALAMAAAATALLAGPAQAQDDGFDFSEDEVEEFGEGLDFTDEEEGWGDEGDGTGDDGWGETTDEVVPVGPVDDGITTVTGLFVPSGAIDPAIADALTETLLNELSALEGYTTVSNESLRTEFDIMGAELAFECAFDPICLGRYGRQLGLDKVVVGRVDATDDGWQTTIDLIDSNSASIENYRFFQTEARLLDVQETLAPQLRTLFGLRVVGDNGPDVRQGPSPVQRAMAWTTLGLGVASLGAGVAFGLQASAAEKDLTDCNIITIDLDAELFACEQTQREAQATIDDGKKAALLSNIFLGTGLFLSAGSIVLFTVTPGGDIDEDADLASRQREFRIAPVFARDRFGVSGSIEF